jgi:hypothetical protein
MDWTDLTQVEAYVRNLLVWIGRQLDLPLTGKDWEIAALAVVALIALVIWTWPTRRAFRIGGPLRFVVAGLNLASLAFWPLWFLALILSGIRRGTPALPRTAATGAVPALLLGALKTLARTAAQKSAPGGKRVGPWGKAGPSPAPRPAAAPQPMRPGAARPAVQRPQPVPSTTRRGSVLPNRETWIRRR